MREELARVIQQRTGLDESMALQAAEVAIDFLKQRLPPQVASMLDGGSTDLGGLGGLFGSR